MLTGIYRWVYAGVLSAVLLVTLAVILAPYYSGVEFSNPDSGEAANHIGSVRELDCTPVGCASENYLEYGWTQNDGDKVWISSACDGTADGDTFAGKVIKYNGVSDTVRDYAPGGNCGVHHIVSGHEPAMHRAQNFYSDDSANIKAESPWSCHNPSSRYC